MHMPPKGERFPVPLELIHGVPVFRVKLNGQNAWAILDNRATVSLIGLEFAESQKLPLGPVIAPFKTPTGALEHRRTDAVTVEIPGQLTFTAPFSVVDTSFFEKAIGRPVSLVVGHEYLSNLAFIVRPSRGSLQVGPSGTANVPPNAPVVPLTSTHPQVDVRVGDQTLNLTIDLGFNGDIALTPAAWNRLRLDKLPATYGKGANAQGDLYDVKYVKLPSATIGPLTATNVSASVRPTTPADVDGLLGMGFLRRYDFVLDIKARKLWLIDPKASQAAPPSTTSSN
jgi:hypothetical protein